MKNIMIASIWLVLFLFTVSTNADEVAVNYTVIDSQTEGEFVRTTLIVEVMNLTNSELLNVDLRYEDVGPGLITDGVLQFGNIKKQGINVKIGELLLDQEFFDSTEVMLFRADYDYNSGNHNQDSILGVRR